MIPKNVRCLFAFFLLTVTGLTAQNYITYTQSFDSLQLTGWTFYQVSGTANWQVGSPSTPICLAARSGTNVLATNLSGSSPQQSLMYAESPVFDFTGLSADHVVTFYRKSNLPSQQGINLQYSTDGGVTWAVLAGAPGDRMSWGAVNVSGIGLAFTGLNNAWNKGIHKLNVVAGFQAVKFRFQFSSMNNTLQSDGFFIDDFTIEPDLVDYQASPGQLYVASANYPDFDVKSNFGYSAYFALPGITSNAFYFSTDNVLDPGDSLLGVHTALFQSWQPNYTRTFLMPPNLAAGDYYIFYVYDEPNLVTEYFETNNTSYCILRIEPTFTLPWVETFDDTLNDWELLTSSSSIPPLFEIGSAQHEQAFGVHNGSGALFSRRWYSNVNNGSTNTIVTPFLDFRNNSSNVLCFWMRRKFVIPTLTNEKVWQATAVDPLYQQGAVYVPLSHQKQHSQWDCQCYPLNTLAGHPSSKAGVQLSVRGYQYGNAHPLYVLDDLYVGPGVPDLTIENADERYTTTSDASHTMKFDYYNGGITTAPVSEVHFYYSADSLYNSGDIFLGSLATPAQPDTSFSILSFTYTKPVLTPGLYYVVYRIDTLDQVNEMREYNNTGFIRVFQTPAVSSAYTNDFEQQTNGWHERVVYGTSLWVHGTPAGNTLNQPFSGTQAYTSQSCQPTDSNSFCQLYTPVFDISQLSHPVVKFKLDYDPYSFFDRWDKLVALNMEYSVDGGYSWEMLDTLNTHTYSFSNWGLWESLDLTEFQTITHKWGHNTEYGPDSIQQMFISRIYNTRKFSGTRELLSTMALDTLRAYNRIQFRYNLTFPFAVGGEGVILDDFSVGEGKPDLVVTDTVSLMESPMARVVNIQVRVRNNGEYISKNSMAEFYLSADSIFDPGDYLAATKLISRIVPGKFYDYQVRLNTPLNDSAGSFNWVIGRLDTDNRNAEWNENNNVFIYRLNTNQVTAAYPYLSDFTQNPPDGWKWYHDSTGFRNVLMYNDPFEILSPQYHPTSGFFSSRYNGNDSYTAYPRLYFESPSFDFSAVDSVSFDFLLRSTGVNNQSGGNLQYSFTGGQYWSTLHASTGTVSNWYQGTQLVHLDGESGWVWMYPGSSHVQYGARFFARKPDVKFRFKYRSNHVFSSSDYQGFSLDSFRVDGYTANYRGDDNMLLLNTVLLNGSTPVPVTITNNGQTAGRTCKLKFYWSPDAIFDQSDMLIQTVNRAPVANQQTVTVNVNIPHQGPIVQLDYYLFCEIDANDTLYETNENDNLNSYHLVFDQTIGMGEHFAGQASVYATPAEAVLNLPGGCSAEVTFLLYDNQGRLLVSETTTCNGEQQLRRSLPEGLAAGIYQVKFRTGEQLIGCKVYCGK